MVQCNTLTAIQRRHIAFGIILFFFSLALIIAEANRPSSSHAGYWVGAVGALPTAFAIACGAIESRLLLIIACVCDFLSAITCVAGSILSLVFFSVQVYAVGWLSVILTTFLLYHAFAVCGELDICCRMATFELSDRASEEGGGTRHHTQDIPAPPIGFIMPDEVPKPPNYEQLSVRGHPPPYDIQSSLQPPSTPPPPRRRSHSRNRRNAQEAHSGLARIPVNVAPFFTPSSHPRETSRSRPSHARSSSATRAPTVGQNEEGETMYL